MAPHTPGTFRAGIGVGLAFAVCLVAPTHAQQVHDGLLGRAQEDPEAAFQEWAVQCGKAYSSKQAEQEAFVLFKQRAQAAAAVNANPAATYEAAINCLADMPLPVPGSLRRPTSHRRMAQAPPPEPEATAAAMSAAAGAARKAVNSNRLGFKKPADAYYTSAYRAVGYLQGTFQCPDSMDWTKLGVVTAVKNQGDSCGTCWAFAATGAMEAAYAITYGKLVGLSEAQLIDCTYTSGISNGCSTTYTVKPGDDCYTIWTNNGLTEGQFRALNPTLNCDPLMPDQEVCVGTFGGYGGCTNPYNAVEGDNCWDIWTRNGLSESQFKALNPNVNCDPLSIGTFICLKVGGCPAGYMDDAFKYTMFAGGIYSSGAYGLYVMQQQVCKVTAGQMGSQPVDVQLIGYTSVLQGEQELLKVVCNQPVAVSLTVTDEFLNYKRGVFNPSWCPSDENSLNHAVLIVGYGRDAATGLDFWLVKNSYGTNWGDKGYMRIRRGSNTCGIVTLPPTYPTVLGADLPARVPDPPPSPGGGNKDPDCYSPYTVQAGDTMFGISGKFKVNFLTLWAANPGLQDPDVIYEGQQLNIPCPRVRSCTATVVVQEGQSLWLIGNQNGVELQDVLNANPQFVNPDLIYPGDIVYIPPCNDAPPEAALVSAAKGACVLSTYTAVAGDHPGRVAAAHSMNVGDLYQLNPQLLRNPKITRGQVLKVRRCPVQLRPPWFAGMSCVRYATPKANTTPKEFLATQPSPRPSEPEFRCANGIDMKDTKFKFGPGRSTCIPDCCSATCVIKPSTCKLRTTCLNL